MANVAPTMGKKTDKSARPTDEDVRGGAVGVGDDGAAETTAAIDDQIAALGSMGSTALQNRYRDVLGKPTTSCNVLYLRGAIAKALLDKVGHGS
jgi:hypothetical protein